MEQGVPKRLQSLIRALAHPHGRKKHRLCLCEGVRCCNELLAARPELIECIVCSEQLDRSLLHSVDCEQTYIVTQSSFEHLTATRQPQGVLIVSKIPAYLDVSAPVADPLTLVLDRISDPGNLGTICRTARAAGLSEIWLTEGGVDPFNEKAIRSGMGSQFCLKFRRFSSLQALVETAVSKGIDTVYRTDPHQGLDCFAEEVDYTRAAVVLGSEAHGASANDQTTALTINMPGDAESLNVAQAATIILFDFLRRRRDAC